MISLTNLLPIFTVCFFANFSNGLSILFPAAKSLSSSQRYSANGNELVTNRINRSSLPPTKDIVGIIFDMDGTLIKPVINFAEMRKRIFEIADRDPELSCQPEEKRRGDVLLLYQMLSVQGQREADSVFKDIEARAIADMMLMDGIGELCQFMDSRGMQRAVLTRNVQLSIDVMHKKLWDQYSVKEFYPSVHRLSVDGDGNILPSKPNPDAIHYICQVWSCKPSQILMVGDSCADDIVAASRAECGGSVLLKYMGKDVDNDAGGGIAKTDEEWQEREPTLSVTCLNELRKILERNDDSITI
jgi:phosphoglycolate phosphatase-like HAD superfamily hydrolase